MTALFLKDLFNLRRQYLIIGFLFLFFAVLTVSTGETGTFPVAITMTAVALTLTAISYDEQSHWDRYALTMPISRTDLVLAKYLLAGVFTAAGFLLNIAMRQLTSQGTLLENLLASAPLFAGTLFFLSIALPVLFRFGVERGRFLLLGVFLLPVTFVLLSGQLGFQVPAQPPVGLGLIVTGALAVIVALSFSISRWIVNTKEY